MAVMLFFTMLAVAALAAAWMAAVPRLARVALVVMSPALLVLGLIMVSSIVVPVDQTGVINKLFGTPLPFTPTELMIR